MTPLLNFILLLLIAYVGSTLYHRYENSPLWLKSIIYSGSVHLLIGLLIGPNFLNLLSPDVLDQLDVIIGFVLGWTGFLIGLQGKRSVLIRFQKSYYLFSTLNFICMFSLFLLLLYLCSQIFNIQFSIMHIALLALMGTVSSPIWIAVLRRDFKLRGTIGHLLQFSIAFDNMLGVFFLGMVLLIVNPHTALSISGIYFIFLALALIGIISWIFYIITEKVTDVQQYFLILIGVILLVVGIAMNLNISILFFSFLFGLIITNMPIATRKLYQSIANAEKPLYVIMLVFIGAYVQSISWTICIMLCIFISLRILLKYFSGFLARLPIVSTERPIRAIGLTHLGMGGVSLAFALDYYRMDTNPTSYIILVISVGAVIITDLYSLRIVKGLLKE
jgi:Kef-type K+ transport system membrane component KefB